MKVARASPVYSTPAVDSKPATSLEPLPPSDRSPTIRQPSAFAGGELAQEFAELKELALNDIVELRADVEKLSGNYKGLHTWKKDQVKKMESVVE